MFEESTGADNVPTTALGKKDGAAWLEKVRFRVGEQIDIDRLDRKIVFDPLEIQAFEILAIVWSIRNNVHVPGLRVYGTADPGVKRVSTILASHSIHRVHGRSP